MTTDAPQGELIAAVATPPGQGGVGIVRLSGEGALAAGAKLTGKTLPAREVIVTSIFGQDEILDQGVAIAFNRPHSFTGEDVVELQCHGSPVVLQRVLDAAGELGARIARPGEFSERAFLNNKIDLAQAEAVADLIASGSVQAARAAMRSLQGVFSERVLEINSLLEHTRILLEASIDFPEEEEDFLSAYDIPAKITDIQTRLDGLLVDARKGQVYRDGCAVALIGPPNAGKSSLLNAFSGEDTAIVTDIPGTTRDLLKVDLVLEGVPVRIVDTAGLRQAQDKVEQEGIVRALDQIAQADVVVMVLDAAGVSSASAQRDATLAITDLARTDPRLITVLNKSDLLEETKDNAADLRWVSAKTQSGLHELSQAIAQQAGAGGGEVLFTARARHVAALTAAEQHLREAQVHIKHRTSGEVIAEELRLAHHAMGEIVGLVTPDELLGKIFSQFCIGK